MSSNFKWIEATQIAWQREETTKENTKETTKNQITYLYVSLSTRHSDDAQGHIAAS